MEKSHGRGEARAYHVMDAATLADTFPEWKGLKSAGVTLMLMSTHMDPFDVHHNGSTQCAA